MHSVLETWCLASDCGSYIYEGKSQFSSHGGFGFLLRNIRLSISFPPQNSVRYDMFWGQSWNTLRFVSILKEMEKPKRFFNSPWISLFTTVVLLLSLTEWKRETTVGFLCEVTNQKLTCKEENARPIHSSGESLALFELNQKRTFSYNLLVSV